MKNFYYELMKNYGSGETKLEVVLFTLLNNDMKFRKTFLSKAFKNKFDYESATIEKEVGRTSLGQGRTDIEITDNKGNKYILELKAGWAYPTKAQIDMYKSIKEVKEVATLTNITDNKSNECNTTWAETAAFLKDRVEFESVYNFLNDFGPANGKGYSALGTKSKGKGSGPSGNEDSILFSISDKKGNFENDWTGVSIFKEFNTYIIPSPTNEKITKGYVTLREGIKYLGFKWKDETTKTGEVNVALCLIKKIENLSPEEINKKLKTKVVWVSEDKRSGDHYFFELELIGIKKMIPYQGMAGIAYFNHKNFEDLKIKSVEKLVAKD